MAKSEQVNVRLSDALISAIDARREEVRRSTGINPSRGQVVRGVLAQAFNVEDTDDDEPAPKAKPAKKGARK